MKYCFTYNRLTPNQYYNTIDELEIMYRAADLTLPHFLEEHKDQTVVISLGYDINDDDIKRLSLLNEKYHNIKLRIPIDLYYGFPKIKDIPYFFDTYVNDWDIFNGILELNPTDIYITGSFGFWLSKIAPKAHAKGINIRCFANIAQSSWEGGNGITRFFIRPEDVDTYENYIDILEFICTEDRQKTYYEIYAKDKMWFGPLNEIILNLNSNIDNRGILSVFGEKRCGCQKKCASGGACRICYRIAETADTIVSNNYYIQKKTN